VSSTSPAAEQVSVDEPAVEAFRSGLRGRLLRPGEDGYEEARAIWNAMINKRPAFIAQCAGAADVVSAVNFARDHGLLLAVRGGGHNWAGLGTCDGGLVIDLSPMKGIRVDLAARTVTAQAGVTWGELDRECQSFGLVTNGGHVTTTGIAGLTLGGGIGWLCRKFGLASDNLLSADVVTADARLLTVDEHMNPELFWAIRGGGGNFGVVTSLTYRLHPLEMVIGGLTVYPIDRAPEVLRFHREVIGWAPDELTTIVGMFTAPAAPFLPEELHGKRVVAFAVCYAGDLDEGMRVVGPIKAYGRPAADLIGPMPYVAQQMLFDWAFPHGQREYLKSLYLQDLRDDVVELIASWAADMPSPAAIVGIHHYGGAVSRLPEGATAFGGRHGELCLVITPRWTDASEDETIVGWTRGLFEATLPYAHGVYVNFLGEDDGEVRVRSAYGTALYDRLAQVKRAYDPDNLFRVNHNIKPAADRNGDWVSLER
jgi:FAD/FMN-containing dehydrogenase